MRNILLICCFFLTCCEKEKEQTELLKGVWELRSRFGGFNPDTYIVDPPGSGNLLKFSGYNYKEYVKGQLTKSGTYSLIKDSLAIKGPMLNLIGYEMIHRIYFDNENFGTVVKLKNDTSIYNYGSAQVDGVESTYKKISDNSGF